MVSEKNFDIIEIPDACLNPCFMRTWSRSNIKEVEKINPETVLILVLCGHGLGVLKNNMKIKRFLVLILVLCGHGLGAFILWQIKKHGTVLILVLCGHGLGVMIE